MNKKIYAIVSLLSLILLFIPPDITIYHRNVNFLIGIFTILSLIYILRNRLVIKRERLTLSVSLVLLFVYSIIGYFYVMHALEYPSKLLSDFAHYTEIPIIAITISIFLFLALLSTYIVFCFVCKKNESKIDSRKNNNSPIVTLVLAITATFVISVFSQSSPLYPLNPWDDANVFHTIGKSMLSGLLPYRDIFDHKGPLLYIIHALNAIISYKAFIGIYILEIVCCFFFLLFSYKTISLLTDKDPLCIIPVIAFIVYSSCCFEQGDSAEELCLPFMSYTLWVSLKNMSEHSIPDRRESLLIGSSLSIIFWIKYTILGFYIGLFISFVIYIIYHGIYRKFIQSLTLQFTGAIIVSIPILAYFIANSAIYDLFMVYFYENIFNYNQTQNETFIIHFLKDGLYNSTYILNYIFTIAIIISFVVVSTYGKWLTLSYILCFLSSTIFVYAASRIWSYYPFVLSIFVPLGVIPLLPLIEQMKKIRWAIVSIICIPLIFCSTNINFIMTKKDARPQYKFKEIIHKKNSPTLLNYMSMDAGVYAVTGVIPPCKYSSKFNLRSDSVLLFQNKMVEMGVTDFLVMKQASRDTVSFSKYRLLSEDSFPNRWGALEYYFLYERIENKYEK